MKYSNELYKLEGLKHDRHIFYITYNILDSRLTYMEKNLCNERKGGR